MYLRVRWLVRLRVPNLNQNANYRSKLAWCMLQKEHLKEEQTARRFKSPAQRRLFQTQKTLRSSHLAPLCICFTLHMSNISGFNLMFMQCASSHMFVFWLLLVGFKCFQDLEVA